MWRKGKREGGRGERGREACYKNPLLFISADAGVRKFLIGWAEMSNLLACILACISVREKHDEGITKIRSTGISFGRSKLLQSCSNFTFKPDLNPTVEGTVELGHRVKSQCFRWISRDVRQWEIHIQFVRTILFNLCKNIRELFRKLKRFQTLLWARSRGNWVNFRLPGI